MAVARKSKPYFATILKPKEGETMKMYEIRERLLKDFPDMTEIELAECMAYAEKLGQSHTIKSIQDNQGKVSSDGFLFNAEQNFSVNCS